MRSSTNYLLAKDDVGKSKPSMRSLPGKQHTFGYKEKPDDVGVGGCKSSKIYSVTLSYLIHSDILVENSSD